MQTASIAKTSATHAKIITGECVTAIAERRSASIAKTFEMHGESIAATSRGTVTDGIGIRADAVTIDRILPGIIVMDISIADIN